MTTFHDQTETITSTDRGSDPLRIAVIVASVRDPRVGHLVGAWVHGRCAELDGVETDLIDLSAVELPPAAKLRPGGSGATDIAWRLDRSDAFVVVTPEYNHSFPASLKDVIDWHYGEWAFKAACVVPYGVTGGLLAAEQLRSVFAELSIVTTRRTVGLSQPWTDLGAGAYLPPEGVDEALGAALAELHWWAQTLRTARRERPFHR